MVSLRLVLPSDTTITKNFVILELLENVKSRLHFWKFVDNKWSFCGAEAGKWDGFMLIVGSCVIAYIYIIMVIDRDLNVVFISYKYIYI